MCQVVDLGSNKSTSLLLSLSRIFFDRYMLVLHFLKWRSFFYCINISIKFD